MREHVQLASAEEVIERAEALADQLRETIRGLRARAAPARDVVQEAAREAERNAERHELEQLVMSAERHAAQLANLYVATYQLHATLDPAEVQAAIADIACNLLGAERFLLLLRDEPTGLCRVALEVGSDSGAAPLTMGSSYAGGDAMIDACLRDGATRLGPQQGSGAVAVVPLVVHKGTLQREDRELLDLLGAHAGSALFAAQVFQERTRKLRTLEGLMALLRNDRSGVAT
jgi:hypothetical protein